MHGYLEYNQLRDEVVALKGDLRIRYFKDFIALTAVFVLLFLIFAFPVPYIIFAFPGSYIWLKVIGMITVSVGYLYEAYRISNTEDHKKLLHDLEEKRHNEVYEIVQKHVDKYKEEHKSNPHSFFSNMLKDEIEDLKTRYKNIAAAAFVSSFISALVSFIQTGLEYYVSKVNLADAKELYESLKQNALDTDEISNELADAADSLVAAQSTFESAENAFLIACLVLFAIILLIIVVNFVESIIKPLLYNKIKNLRYAYYILDEMNQPAIAATVSDAAVTDNRSDAAVESANPQCCPVCKEVLVSSVNNSSNVRDLIDLLNTVNGIVSENNNGSQQNKVDSGKCSEDKSEIDPKADPEKADDPSDKEPEQPTEKQEMPEDSAVPEEDSNEPEPDASLENEEEPLPDVEDSVKDAVEELIDEEEVPADDQEKVDIEPVEATETDEDEDADDPVEESPEPEDSVDTDENDDTTDNVDTDETDDSTDDIDADENDDSADNTVEDETGDETDSDE